MLVVPIVSCLAFLVLPSSLSPLPVSATYLKNVDHLEQLAHMEDADQHQKLYNAIVEGREEDARAIAGEHIQFVQQTISERSETARRRERALRREGSGEHRAP